MVNIGGRSKGCSGCRRRRIKCDENRPTCMRCQKAGLKCDGPKDFTFVDATIVASRRRPKQTQGLPSPTPSIASSEASVSVRSMTPPIRMLGDPQEICIMFTRSHLAQGGPVDITLQELQSKDLPLLETNSATACRTAHLRTVQSFATIFFGTKHKQPEITQRGYIQHGATLQQLNRALTEPHCYRYDEIIQSVMTLAIQETLVPSGANLFMKHMQGLEKLLALRDPDLYSPPSTVSLYKCLRHMLLFASLIGGTPSILARPDWKEMFHRHCANDKEEQEQQLYDFLADCSVLASKRDALLKETTRSDGVTSDFDEVQRDALHLGDQLRAWRAEWAIDPTNAYVEISSSSVQPHGQPEDISVPPSPTDLQFSNIKCALTLMLYNIALLYLLKVLTSLPTDPRQEESQTAYIKAAHSTVLDVCRIMPGPFNTEWQKELHASPVVHWAVESARMILQGDESAEAKWLTDMLDRKSGKTLAGAMEET
ncbi:hypothetical protein HBI47_117570 [Parastagonospora nodorum]|nr:hypothetical protein HBI47_117570 [Parastagonospora nodorum]